MTLNRLSVAVLADRLTLTVFDWLNRIDSVDSILTIIGYPARLSTRKQKNFTNFQKFYMICLWTNGLNYS